MLPARTDRVSPFVLLSLAMLAVTLAVAPWGDYPVNDDWQYARIVKRLAETGRFQVDVFIAPSLVAQALVTAPLVKAFGFSHALLRMTTIVVSVVLLWAIDRILRLSGTPRRVRALAAVLLLGNPLFLHLAFSYMTEIYGYALALAGAVVWLAARQRRQLPDDALIGWGGGLLAAALIGASFWVRQFCVAVYPALVGAALLRAVANGERARIRQSLPVLGATMLVLTAIVGSYFPWAMATGNFKAQFEVPLEQLRRFDPALLPVSAFELAAYLSLFLFPYLLLERWQRTRWRRFAIIAAGALVVICATLFVRAHFTSFHHPARFPYSANVVHDTGIGPITLTPTYLTPGAPRPHWPRGAWLLVEGFALASLLLWARLGASAGDRRPTGDAAEIRDFGLLFAGLSFLLYVQASQWQALDRYFLPCLFGVVIALSARQANREREPGVVPLLACVPLLCFTIAGTHDYFRWNDARWAAVDIVSADGGSPGLLDGGFEVNGWLNYDATVGQVAPRGCHGTCGCNSEAFYCTDDTYLISMELPPGRVKLAELPVTWWLASGPNIIVSRR